MLIVMALAGVAWTAELVVAGPAVRARLVDGKSVYGGERYGRLMIVLQPKEGEGGVDTTGATITLYDSVCVYGPQIWRESWKDDLYDDGRLVPRKELSFGLKAGGADADEPKEGENFHYFPINDKGEVVGFYDAGTGLNGRKVSWDFPNSPKTSGSATISYRTAAEQMEDRVPYVELIRDGEYVTGVRFRIVHPSDTSKALPLGKAARISIDVHDRNGNGPYTDDDDTTLRFGPNDPVQGKWLFSGGPISEADLRDVQIDYYEIDGGAPNEWVFVVSTPGSKPDESGIKPIGDNDGSTNEDDTIVTITIRLTGGKQLIDNIVYFWLRLGKLLTADEASISPAVGDLYGPYEGTLGADGKLKIDVNALKPVSGSGAPTSISAGEYVFLVQGKTDAATQPDVEKTQMIEGVQLAATSGGNNNGSSGGGGCSSAGFGCLALGLAFLLRRRA